jgi:hypothetical protein
MTTLRQLPDGTERPLLFQLSLWQSGKMALIRQDTGSKKKAVSLPWMSDHIDTVDYGTPVVRTSARICTTLTSHNCVVKSDGRWVRNLGSRKNAQ